MNTILEERDVAVAYLSDKDTPLFTHAELADLIDAFVDHLQCNRDALVRTGRYRIDFGRSEWLHASLTNLYYTKLPSSGSNIRIGLAKEKHGLSLDPCGHHLPIDQYQANCYHVNTTEECREFKGIDTPECGYLETDSFSELDSSASLRIETNRVDFFSLKLRVLSILRNAVANRDSLNLWADCLDVLTQTLTGEEAEFYLKMDRFYLGYDLITGEILEETDLRPVRCQSDRGQSDRGRLVRGRPDRGHPGRCLRWLGCRSVRPDPGSSRSREGRIKRDRQDCRRTDVD